jgi:4-hydroxybenzoate polyprenyltransferase
MDSISKVEKTFSRRRLCEFLEMIKFQHTLFALPFAFVSLLLASEGHLSLRIVFWVIIAMIGARTGAMGFNRIIDAVYDRQNPRTKTRAIPAGKISAGFTAVASLLSFALFVFSAAMLNRACLIASPFAILFLVGYSYTKRFTSLSHLILGFVISGAPLGAWLAVTGTISYSALILASAVLFWIAGFDILYSLQDMEFDRKTGLHSIPAILGIKPSLIIVRFLHLLTFLLLISLSFSLHLGTIYIIGCLTVFILLAYEHHLVTPSDLSRVNTAFFTVNGLISILFLGFVAAEVFL